MGEKIKNTGSELKNRWLMKMPRFFRMIAIGAINIIVAATAVNFGVPALGGTLYEWWGDVYTHILVGAICTLVTCKVTVAGGYKNIDTDELLRGKIERHIQMERDIDEDTDGEQPGEGQEE